MCRCRLRSQATVPYLLSPLWWLRYGLVGLMLMAALTQTTLAAAAEPPRQPEPVAEGSPPVESVHSTDGAGSMDDMGTKVATLQKQIMAQQTLLQTLQTRLAPENPALSSGHAELSAVTPEKVAPPAFSTVATPQRARAGIDDVLSTKAQQQAYASGVSVWREIAYSLASQRLLGIDLDERYVVAGLQDMAFNHDLKMSEDEIEKMMSALNADYIRRDHDARAQRDREGKAYQMAFSKLNGVYCDDEVWYRIDEAGEGPHLKMADTVVLHVIGTLPDGTVFDSSGQQGQTLTVEVGALLPAVAVGLQKVSPGGRLTIVVPPQKGYGDAGLPPSIPGGATLIFDITVKARD